MQTFLVPLGILSVLSLLVSSFVPQSDGDVLVQEGSWSIEKIQGGSVLDGSEAVYGRASTPYTVVEFADFQCGHCAKTTPKLKKVIGAFSDVVHLKYKHFPLSNKCNHNIDSTFHDQSCQAAYAADCAGRQGKFWEMSKLLFINGSHLSVQSFSFLAEQVKLDHASFDECLNDASIKLGIEKDIQAADTLKVQGTPALYLHDGVDWWKIEDHEVGLEKTLILLKKGQTPPGAQKENPLGAPTETTPSKVNNHGEGDH
jgi:predicted DsbA family dithiol-disulfide isomerase